MRTRTIMNHSEVVWLTGCASGMGLHLADAFLRRGYRVVATDIDEVGLQTRARERNWPTDSLLLRALDVRDVRAWEALAEEVAQHWGRLDILVNNAGYIRPGFLKDTVADEVDLHLDINLKGVIHGSRVAAQRMVDAGRGHIINIASMAALAPIRGLGLYSSAKFGVRAFSLVLAQELAPLGVQVTTVCPDLIKTAMFDKQLDYQKEAALTFSGGKVLTVEDMERVFFEQILPRKPVEIMVPNTRGWLAKVGNLMPGISTYMADYLAKIGEKRLLRERSAAGKDSA